ncbi:GNAT family N-acetyltransferase [Niveibacterium terrae]|uniref:GNAT family N-acetyltransferase n=1 Tax=Niveibacterium terrae TaxID=3373598 RepID=UPI003A91FA7B
MIAHTSRLRLETLSEAHASAMFPVLSDERLYAYIPDVRYVSVEALQERYRRLERGSLSPEELWWNFIVFRHDLPTPIGYVQATLMPSLRLAEVAYVLSPLHWGRGYATEALSWLISEIGRRGDIDRAQAQIDQRNFASIAVVRRLGFMFSRTMVEETSIDTLFERGLNLPA